MEAFYALLKDVLRSTTARWYIKDDLPDLLAARTRTTYRRYRMRWRKDIPRAVQGSCTGRRTC